MKKTLLLVLVCLPLLTTFSQKQTFKFPKSNPVISITCPKDWGELVDDKNYAIANDDLSIVIAFDVMPNVKNSKEAVKECIKKMADQAKSIKKDGDETVWEGNGIKFYQNNHIAKRDDGTELYVTFTYFVPDGKNKLVSSYAATPEADKKYEQVVNDIMDSIKAVKK
jgi:hypothetical protein